MGVARVSIGSAVPALLVALLACAAARVAVVVGGSSCDDGVSCGMGIRSRVNLAYECHCYDGWARIMPSMPLSLCYIPTCPSGHTCYSTTIKIPPFGSNVILHPCLVMDCGPEGTCLEEHDNPLRCQCNPGATNVLKNPSLPCTKNDCIIGEDGCPVQTPPPSPLPPHSSPPSPTTPPDIVHAGPTAPSGTQGSVFLPNLLLPLLLLASLYYIV